MSVSEPASSRPAAYPDHDSDYLRLFQLSLDLLCVAGLDGYFKKVNPAWVETLGWSEQELLSRPVADFMHPEDRDRTLAARADLARGIQLRGLENRYLCKNGLYRWLSWQSSVELSEGKVFAVARDVTEQRRRDREQLLQSRVESTTILAGGIAHDFNNLLGSLQLNIEMVGLVGPLTDEQRRSLLQAQQSLFAAEALTQRLLTFARGATPSRRLMDLKPLLNRSLELALAGSTIRSTCVIAAGLWRVEADEVQIGEVIHGLLSNAREAMPHGGEVTLDAVNITLAKDAVADVAPGPYVRITIADNGTGIGSQLLLKVFGPYFTTKPRSAQKGQGLGLSICRALVRDHGGTITMDSNVGIGTTVTVFLPARPEEAGRA